MQFSQMARRYSASQLRLLRSQGTDVASDSFKVIKPDEASCRSCCTSTISDPVGFWQNCLLYATGHGRECHRARRCAVGMPQERVHRQTHLDCEGQLERRSRAGWSVCWGGQLPRPSAGRRSYPAAPATPPPQAPPCAQWLPPVHTTTNSAGAAPAPAPAPAC